MRITSCGMTDVGVKRTNNEDNYLINDELNLFVVCDGMGGTPEASSHRPSL